MVFQEADTKVVSHRKDQDLVCIIPVYRIGIMGLSHNIHPWNQITTDMGISAGCFQIEFEQEFEQLPIRNVVI